MNYLTSKQVAYEGLDKFRERCGKMDYVTFLQVSAVTHYMLSENRQMGYIGLAVIENREIVADVFVQNEADFEVLENMYRFDWNMSAEEKANILSNYLY